MYGNMRLRVPKIGGLFVRVLPCLIACGPSEATTYCVPSDATQQSIALDSAVVVAAGIASHIVFSRDCCRCSLAWASR